MVDAARPYVAMLGARFRMLLQYSAAAFAGFATQLFWGAIKLMILAAFLAANHHASPMSLPQLAAYVWLGQALLGVLPWNVDAELQEKMMSGAVAYELLRPVDLYAFWYARTMALRTATTFMRMIPMIIFAGFLLPLFGLGKWALPPPASAAACGLLPGLVDGDGGARVGDHDADARGADLDVVGTRLQHGDDRRRDRVLGSGHSAAAVPGLAATAAVLAAVPRCSPTCRIASTAATSIRTRRCSRSSNRSSGRR